VSGHSCGLHIACVSMSGEALALTNVGCGRPVVLWAAHFQLFHRMYRSCFHYEVEHDPGRGLRRSGCPRLPRSHPHKVQIDRATASSAHSAPPSAGSPPRCRYSCARGACCLR
jgi:hypothetical protein